MPRTQSAKTPGTTRRKTPPQATNGSRKGRPPLARKLDFEKAAKAAKKLVRENKAWFKEMAQK